MSTSLVSSARWAFHQQLAKSTLTIDSEGVASNADKAQAASRSIALALAEVLGATRGEKLAGQTAGKNFEASVADFIEATFPKLTAVRPGEWLVWRLSQAGRVGIADTEQFRHLLEVKRLSDQYPELRVALGSDYLITPDILVVRNPEPDESINRLGIIADGESARRTPLRMVNNSQPLAHASVSCKWTMRSDRAQNSRSEALNLIRNRKGRLPHIVVVTGEPTPTRISSLALGTGDIDCVYHFALPELMDVVSRVGDQSGNEMLQMMVEGRRLRDISDLPFDLAV